MAARTNQDILRRISKGYRLEKPNYPGKDANEDQLNGIYGVSNIFLARIGKKYTTHNIFLEMPELSQKCLFRG